MKLIIPRDYNNKIHFGKLALILFLVLLLIPVIFMPFILANLTSFIFPLILLSTLIASIICAIIGLFSKNQRLTSIVILLLEIIIIGCLYYLPKMIIIIPAPSELQVFRSNAKMIQSSLDSYYSEWGSFPDENKINGVLINYCGRIPIFLDKHTKMIKKYRKINKNNYVITFNPYNRGDLEIKNCKLTSDTDTNYLR